LGCSYAAFALPASLTIVSAATSLAAVPSSQQYMLRTVPIFEDRAHPPVWSDRMSHGEFAVLCEDARTGAAKQPDNTPAPNPSRQICTISDSRQEAEDFARDRVERYPTMRCVVFDHEGRAGQPLLTVNRPEFAPRGEIGPAFRRWVGGICLVAGLACGAWEIAHDYATIWAGALAIRLLPVAAVFLGVELVLWAQDKWLRKRLR
jgi:hypothetical protein